MFTAGTRLAPARPLITLIVVLWTSGELGRRAGSVLVGWFLVAAFCQFRGASAFSTTAGLVLQTILAISLILRRKVSG